MNYKHLFWIIPLCILLSGFFAFRWGVQKGLEVFEEIGNLACDLQTEVIEECITLVDYMVRENGVCRMTAQAYIANNSIIWSREIQEAKR